MRETVTDLAVKKAIEAFYTGGIVDWSPDGRYLFSTCSNVAKAIDLDNNLTTYNIGHDDESLHITCLCYDRFRGRLIVAYNNQIVYEYELPTSKDDKVSVARMWKTMHDGPILVMKLSVDGALLATGSADHNVKIWDIRQQQCVHTLKGKEVVSSICFVREERIVVGYIGGKVNLFDHTRGVARKLVHEWTPHTSQVTSIVELPRSRQVVTVSRDQSAAVLEIETHETVKVLPLFEPMESSTVSHNGNLITVGEQGLVKEWMIQTGRLIRQTKVTSCRLDQVRYNSVRDELLVISAEEDIFIINFSTMKATHQIVGFQDEVYSCCLLGTSDSHMAVASNTGRIRLYDTTKLHCKLIQGHEQSVLSLAGATWDRELLASCSKDNSIRLWRLNVSETTFTLVPLMVATGHTSSVNALCLSNSAARPFIVSVSSDTTVKLWSMVDAPLRPKSSASNTALPKLACSSTLVAHAKDVNCVDVSLTNAICATGGMDKMVKLWHVDDQKMQLGIAGALSGHRRGVASVRFAPNAQKIVSCSGDLTLKVWCLTEKTCLQTLVGHGSAVFSAIFINGGTQLLSADSAGVLKIWTLKTGEAEKSIEAHSDKIWTICTTCDESEFVTAGGDGRIVVWKDVSEEKRIEEDLKIKQKAVEEQTLSNLLEQERFHDALNYALGLVRPYCAFKVLNELIGRKCLDKALMALEIDKLQVLLDFATQWNTNSRTSQVSQEVLNSILAIHPPETLLKLPNINSVVLSFLPYTKRHYERLSKARQDVSLLTFTWKQMRLS